MPRRMMRYCGLLLLMLAGIGNGANGPDALVIQFDRYPVSDSPRKDLVPLLRLYASGRALVHLSEQSGEPGDYAVTLPPAAVQALLQVFRQDALAEIDLDSLAHSVAQGPADVGASSPWVSEFVVHDGSTTQTLTWVNLEGDAERFKEQAVLARMAAFERRLLDITERADRRPSNARVAAAEDR